MTPAPSAHALGQLLHQFYPSGLWPDDPAYDASEEAQRLARLKASARRDTQAWDAFVQHVREAFPGCRFWDTTLLVHDPCYRLRVSLPKPEREEDRRDAVVCLLSLLAPTYVIYASHFLDDGRVTESWTRYPPLPPEFQPQEAGLASLIESTFHFARLPEEVLFTPVPDLTTPGGNLALGKARLIDLLFTPDRP
ncbi:hypothetical protein [Hyalangium gracile]|uniref:hypothetical protein n=1 Tax=Hyalangium gracile TaxID=394092 RepID=UPI001CCCB3CE|nr:hypothetical protein [Hyalangium gracile]